MRFLKPWPCSILGLAATAAALAGVGVTVSPQETADDLVVHEWGTFLSMSGSDGVALDGMYHEEHALPSFVHARSRDQLRLPSVILKGETPVIYFYTERPQKVRVDVRFPGGIWTQWYPQAQVVAPQLSQGAPASELRDGRIVWCAEVLPTGSGSIRPPSTSPDALWNHARAVDAAYVRTQDRTREGTPTEADRFLFYRGLGQVPLPVRFTAEAGGTLRIGSDESHGARHLFILRVEGGRGAYAYRPALQPGESLVDIIPSMASALPLDRFTEVVSAEVRRRLVESGLFEKEAAAMVNTWRNSYFETEGVRSLFVLPQDWTDAFIPLQITPKPRQVVRVMVGRAELLTAERERLAGRAIGDLASKDAAVRERAFGVLREQGRYVEPILRRVLRTTGDEHVRELCRRLLATEFVTELRAAIHDAADGSRIVEDPIFVRARLACLLREIGLTESAKAEGTAVLEALRARAEPPMNDPDARQHLRAIARAQEGLGDDRAAASSYARFIRFGSQVRTSQDCRGCHHDAGPRDMAWFRDWWAGERYATLTDRVGESERAIAEHEVMLARAPTDPAARLMLAYLYEAMGEHSKAEGHWAGLTRTASTGLADNSVNQPVRPQTRTPGR